MGGSWPSSLDIGQRDIGRKKGQDEKDCVRYREIVRYVADLGVAVEAVETDVATIAGVDCLVEAVEADGRSVDLV